MAHKMTALLGAVLVGGILAGCVPVPEPTPTPTASSGAPSSTPSPTPTQAPSPSPTLTPTATATPQPPPADPPPGRVHGLAATMGGGSGEVLLTWTQNPEPDVVSYIVLRSTSPGGALTQIGTFTRQQVTQFPIVPFVDMRATVDYYRVRAVDAAGQKGPLSSEVCGAAVGHTC